MRSCSDRRVLTADAGAGHTFGGGRGAQSRQRRRVTPLKNVADLWLGDILQCKNKSSSTMTHTMVVTNWINKVPYLTYHSRNTLNKPLTALAGLNVTWFASRV